MLKRFLKALIPNFVKHEIALRLPGNENYKVRVEQSQIKAQVQKEVSSYIVDFLPKVEATSIAESSASEPIRSAEQIKQANLQFKDFWQNYQQAYKANGPDLAQFHKDYPVSSSLTHHVCTYYQGCDQAPHAIAQVMKRNAYFVVPFYNSNEAIHLHSYRDKLAKIGFISHPNAEPRQFVLEALNGLAAAEDVDPQMVVDNTWGKRPYDYLRCLKEEIQTGLSSLPQSFFDPFESKSWFIEQIAFRAQCEIGLQQLLEQKRWQAFITGDAGSSLGLALMDTPREKRPPIIYFPHGSPYGHPITAMFLKVDYIFARGNRDANLFTDLGFPHANIIKVGSPSHEAFPDDNVLIKQREMTRLHCQVSEDTLVIVLSVTWDPYLYKSRPPLEIQNLIIESLAQVTKKLPGKKMVLYLKYHPHPVSDPSFSVSRIQFPLHNFLKLSSCGYEVRLANSFDDCLAAADCFIGQESTILCDALALGIPTISMDYAKPTGRPTLDYDTYAEPSVHKVVCTYDSPDTISDAVVELLAKPRSEVRQKCRADWHNVFACGRSEGIARMAGFFKSLLG